MTTLGDLVASIHNSLHSYTGVQEQTTWLTVDISETALALPVAGTEAAFRGVSEIDNELIYVHTVDGSRLSIAPFGRGYRGTTAATHDLNAQVTFDPVFPRHAIRQQVERCVASLFPTLYQIKTSDLTYSTLPLGYSLPTDCEKVLQVKAQRASDPLDYWMPVHHWSFDANSPEANGKALNLLQDLQPGSTIRVVYATRFGTFADDSSTLSSVGLSESHADLIEYGVTQHLIRFLDPARLQLTAVENISRASAVQVGDASRIAGQLYAMYQQRLAEERTRLLELHPPQIHFQR